MDQHVTVDVLFFAKARELVGSAHISLSLDTVRIISNKIIYTVK